MEKVVAIGKFGGEEIKLEASIVDGELVILFDGEQNEMLEPIIMTELKYAPAMGGTFYPEEKSLLNVVNVLQSGWFFKKLISIDIEGEEETIPFDAEDDEIVY